MWYVIQTWYTARGATISSEPYAPFEDQRGADALITSMFANGDDAANERGEYRRWHVTFKSEY